MSPRGDAFGVPRERTFPGRAVGTRRLWGTPNSHYPRDIQYRFELMLYDVGVTRPGSLFASILDNYSFPLRIKSPGWPQGKQRKPLYRRLFVKKGKIFNTS